VTNYAAFNPFDPTNKSDDWLVSALKSTDINWNFYMNYMEEENWKLVVFNRSKLMLELNRRGII